jgi:serine/threonine-protein kinase RsbW
MAHAIHKVESDLEKVAELAAQLNETCAELGIDQASAITLEICIVEAVNNAIEHAYGRRTGNLVEVSLELRGTRLVVEICDTGTAMQAGRLDAACLAVHDTEDISSWPERGMGLGMIKDAMDEVQYTTTHGVNKLMFSTHVKLAPSTRAVEAAT